VPVKTIEQTISQMLTSGFLLLKEIDGEPLIFLPHLRKAEDGIARKIKRLAAAGVAYPEIEFERRSPGARRRPARCSLPAGAKRCRPR
jgi:hypothetical protein